MLLQGVLGCIAEKWTYNIIILLKCFYDKIELKTLISLVLHLLSKENKFRLTNCMTIAFINWYTWSSQWYIFVSIHCSISLNLSLSLFIHSLFLSISFSHAFIHVHSTFILSLSLPHLSNVITSSQFQLISFLYCYNRFICLLHTFPWYKTHSATLLFSFVFFALAFSLILSFVHSRSCFLSLSSSPSLTLARSFSCTLSRYKINPSSKHVALMILFLKGVCK